MRYNKHDGCRIVIIEYTVFYWEGLRHERYEKDMELFKLLTFFETAPCVRLFRAEYAPYIIFFLHQNFKSKRKTLWSQPELTEALREFQEEMHEVEGDVLLDKPEKYLDEWCSGERHWLRRSLGKGSEYVFQLTPDSEAVLGFVDQRFSSENATIGTGSRLKRAIEMLTEIVIKASTEPDEKINYLTAEKERIEREIDKIQLEGIVVPESPAILREDFATAVSMLKQLQGDFRAVEERFKNITRQVQQKINERNEVRGKILDSVFDSDDALKNDDQGISFRAFCRFLYSDAEQDKFDQTVRRLKILEALSSCAEELNILSELIPLLTDEAERIQRTTQRLGGSLRRLLDTKTYDQRQRVGEVLDEIRKLAGKLTPASPVDRIQFFIEEDLDISAPFMLNFWMAPQQLAMPELTEAIGSEEERDAVFREFAEMEGIPRAKIKENIEKYTANNTTVSLKTILDQEPVTVGVLEVIGYLQVAEDEGHYIYPNDEEKIRVAIRGSYPQSITLTIPRILFVPHSSRKHNNG